MTRPPFRLEPIDGPPERWRVVRTKTEQEIARDGHRLKSASLPSSQLEDWWRLLSRHFGL